MVLPLLAGWAADHFLNDDGVTKKIGDLGADYMNSGKNRTPIETYKPGAVNWGGTPDAAKNFTNMGITGMNSSNQAGGWAQGQAQMNRGEQASENPYLQRGDEISRYNQLGALDLSRQAALGNAPSQAQGALQSGLNQAAGQQAAMAGGARGAGGIAVAGSQAAGATSGLQQQAFNQSSQLRAQEMAQARDAYSGQSNAIRSSDLNRLQVNNQNNQFNASLNDQYRMGMGGLANQANQTGLGYYQAAQNPFNQQGQLQLGREQIAADSHNQAQAARAGIGQANTDARARQADRLWGFAGGMMNTAGGAAASQFGPPKK